MWRQHRGAQESESKQPAVITFVTAALGRGSGCHGKQRKKLMEAENAPPERLPSTVAEKIQERE
jgi:hypothetical protein